MKNSTVFELVLVLLSVFLFGAAQKLFADQPNGSEIPPSTTVTPSRTTQTTPPLPQKTVSPSRTTETTPPLPQKLSTTTHSLPPVKGSVPPVKDGKCIWMGVCNKSPLPPVRYQNCPYAGKPIPLKKKSAIQIFKSLCPQMAEQYGKQCVIGYLVRSWTGGNMLKKLGIGWG